MFAVQKHAHRLIKRDRRVSVWFLHDRLDFVCTPATPLTNEFRLRRRRLAVVIFPLHLSRAKFATAEKQVGAPLKTTSVVALVFGKRCFAARARSLSSSCTHSAAWYLLRSGGEKYIIQFALSHSLCSGTFFLCCEDSITSCCCESEIYEADEKKAAACVVHFSSCDGLIERKMRRLEYEFALIDVNALAAA